MLTCQCGWDGGRFPTKMEAQLGFKAHLRPAMPICGSCQQVKTHKEMSKGARHLCKECAKQKLTEWKAENPDRYKIAQRRSYLMKTFGITQAEFEALFAEQGYVCAICGNEPNDRRGFKPHIDHDHVTGEVRGVLCQSCNMGLGNFKDDRALLLAAIDYLDQGSVDLKLWQVDPDSPIGPGRLPTRKNLVAA